MSYEAWGEPRESGPTCYGCGEFLTLDEMQGDAHECRVSSAELTVEQIAAAQAGCYGDRWEVDANGHGFVVFSDPLAARAARRAPSPADPATDAEG